MKNPNLGSHGVYAKTHETSDVLAFGPEVDRTTILIGFYLHTDLSPITSENFTISRDSVSGTLYDTVLYASDLSADIIVQDLVVMFEEPFYLIGGDVIRVDYANPDSRQLNLTLIVQEAKLRKSI